MTYRHIKLPEGGEKIRISKDLFQVPHNPVIGCIEGDGIGPDITRATLRVLDAAVQKAYGGKRAIHWCEVFMGEKAAGLYDGDYFPGESLDALREIKVALKGPLTTPVGGGFRSLNVSLRQELDLYACVRPVRYYSGVPSPMKKPEEVDVVIFRENTEDVYAGIEYQSGTPENEKLAKFLREEMGAEFFEGASLGIKPISKFGTSRLVRRAIRYAINNNRESVTLVHKGNIMKFTEGSFRNWGYEVAREEFAGKLITEDELYSAHGGKMPKGKILIKDRIADIMFQLMQLRPSEFDVIATMNLNGDYLSDALAAEVGGIGIAPGANVSDDIAVFEATHGTAPKYAGQDKVNPSSLLLSGVMLLEFIEWFEAADLINAAYPKVIGDKFVTYDFARQMEGAHIVSTSTFADALIARISGSARALARFEKQRKKIFARDRKKREKRRVKNPLEAMRESGRHPSEAMDIMSAIVSTAAHTPVKKAVREMRRHKISSILVEPQAGGGEWGIMTQNDVVTKIVGGKAGTAVTVHDIATRPLVTVPRHAKLRQIAQTMTEKKVRRVVVAPAEPGGKPLGVVSQTDLFQTVDEFGWGPEE